MVINEFFDKVFYINLPHRQSRRASAEKQLAGAGIEFERFPAIRVEHIARTALFRNLKLGADDPGDLAKVGPFRGYENLGRYSLALAQRLILRAAKLRKWRSVLILEDDVIFHPNFKAIASTIEVPEDWAIFYLGCSHTRVPSDAGSRLLRVHGSVDTHAIGFHESCYDRALEILDRHGKPDLGVAPASDQFIACLHGEVPVYSAFPNLAWQDAVHSDLLGSIYTNYGSAGAQRVFTETVSSLANAAADRPPKPAFLFLTREDHKNVGIWEEYLEGHEGRFSLFTHAKNPPAVESDLFRKSLLGNTIETSWGDVSLVVATLALLERAMEDPANTHFVLLSESCIPIRPFSHLLRRLELDPRPQIRTTNLENSNPRHVSRSGRVPQIPKDCWRFHSQWWMLDRTAAEYLLSQDLTALFHGMTAPDEAYFGTVLFLLGYPIDDWVVNKPITWTHWEKDSGSPKEFTTIPHEHLAALISSECYFARKFSAGNSIAETKLHVG